MIGPELRRQVDAWLGLDPDADTRAELQDLLAAADHDGDAADDLADRFSGRLRFGTAGLRAELGPGPNRMNRVVVRQAAAGLMRHLTADRVPRAAGAAGHALGPGTADNPARAATDAHVGATGAIGVTGATGAIGATGMIGATGVTGAIGATVVIGFDARHKSDVFALDTARVVAAAGGRALLLPEVGPTPLLAFAIRHLGADAGVMCTASHNPASDNGYKVYLRDGAQIIPPFDRQIAAAIDAVAAAGPVDLAAIDDPMIVRLDGAVAAAYEHHVVALVGPGPRDIDIVYTPLHGVGGSTSLRVLRHAGFASVHPVAAQVEPDPDFPTVAFPNPEEPGALDLAILDAVAAGATLILANDPDADRLGVAVPRAPWDDTSSAGYAVLTGNEIGALLGEHQLTSTDGDDRLVVNTFVSSGLLRRLAADHGVHHAEVLTGFKWVVRPAIEHPEWRFVFGFEEALGYSVDAYIRDKDGISAALAFAALTARLRADGSTVWDELERLSRRHGHHATRMWPIRFGGADARERMAATVRRWRASPPAALAGDPVERFTDMGLGEILPPADALVLDLASGGRVIARPSGTEPKVKFYFEVVGDVPAGPDGFARARAAGDATIEALRRAVSDDLRRSG